MGQEIYYTSAPEGLKPNTRGFCTVAASDGLPKALWDRLESLSAYRHHFPSGSGQTNPTAFAHWVVTLAGREYHALSRVTDSGMDYTQRTNAFAHHLIVDPPEMAPAGPAWMLRQPGVMQTQWDGKVGPINRDTPLPLGSAGPAPCATWAQATGDAGYAGLLAESAAKNPNRPVCILFAPGMDLLPLIDEVLRLLPAPVRWQVSFSTYFTSAPTTVLCAWRCCLAGTPAAEAARRFAASGLFLDLTGGKLPPLVESPWTVLARTGQPVAATAPRATLAKPAPAPAVPPMQKSNAPKPDWAARQSGSAAGGAGVPSGNAGVSPAAAEAEPPLDFADSPPAPVGPRFSDEDLAAYNALIAEAEARAAGQKQSASASSYRASGLIQTDAPRRSDSPGGDSEKLKKVSFLAVGILAVVAIAVVVVMAVIMLQTTPKVEPVVVPASAPAQAVADVPKTIPAATETVVVVPPIKPAVTEPSIVIPEKPLVEIPPVLVTIKQPLEWPKSGLAAKAQLIALPREVEHIDKLTSLKITFGNKSATTTIQVDGKDATLFAEPVSLKPALAIRWKRPGLLATDLATVEINPKLGRMEVTWTPSQIMRNPQAAQAAYWTLLGSTFQATDSKGARVQSLQFAPVVIDNISLADKTSTITFPVDIPQGALLRQKGALPDGWDCKWIPGWDPNDPAVTPEKAFQILRYKKPIAGAADAAFELTFRNNMATVESNLVQRSRQAESDLADLESQIQARQAATDEKLKPFQQAVDDAKLLVALSDAELKAKMISRAAAQQTLDDANNALAAKKGKLAAEAGSEAQVIEEKKKLVAGNKLAIDAYRDIKDLEIEVLMPDKTPVATLKFSR